MTFGWQSSSGHLTLCLGTLSLLKVWAWPMDLRGGVLLYPKVHHQPGYLLTYPHQGQEKLCLSDPPVLQGCWGNASFPFFHP